MMSLIHSGVIVFGFLMVVISIMTLSLQRTHFLMSLLSLEAMMLGLFFLLSMSIYENCLEMYLSFVFLTFSACEACLGLALLVCLARKFGKDYLKLLNLHKC